MTERAGFSPLYAAPRLCSTLCLSPALTDVLLRAAPLSHELCCVQYTEGSWATGGSALTASWEAREHSRGSHPHLFRLEGTSQQRRRPLHCVALPHSHAPHAAMDAASPPASLARAMDRWVGFLSSTGAWQCTVWWLERRPRRATASLHAAHHLEVRFAERTGGWRRRVSDDGRQTHRDCTRTGCVARRVMACVS